MILPGHEWQITGYAPGPQYPIDLWPLVHDGQVHGGTAPAMFPGIPTLSHTLMDGLGTLYAAGFPPHFGNDFYYRFHVTFLTKDLGTVISRQEHAWVIWSAHVTTRLLEAINTLAASGIELTGQPNPPLLFLVFQERTYTFTVETDGAPIINSSFTFDFDQGDTIVVELTGVRSTPFSWDPDWSDGILERLEWRTEVLEAYRGQEQRRALRLGARKHFEFSATVTGDQRRRMEALLWDWQARVWLVPMWQDGQNASVTAGASIVSCETNYRQFEAGGYAIFIRSPTDYEIVEINTVGGSQLNLIRPAIGTWADVMLYPARLARMSERVSLPRWDGETSYGRFAFDMTTPDNAAASTDTLHRGFPVWEFPANWSGEYSQESERMLEVLDNITGRVRVEDRHGIPVVRHRMLVTLTSRQETDRYRRRLHQMRGRQRAVWLPSHTNDFTVVTAIDGASQTIEVENLEYWKRYGSDPGRRDVRIELYDGTVFYRHVTSIAEHTQEIERVFIDAPLGVTVQPNQIKLFSFLALVRAEADGIELAHWTSDVAESTLTLRTFTHDV